MTRASKVCAEPGCPNLQPCELHAPQPWAGSTRRSRLPRDWDRIRRRILRRDRHTCQQCGAPGNHVDHIVPGDDHRDTNLQTLCEPCHLRKTAGEAAAARRSR